MVWLENTSTDISGAKIQILYMRMNDLKFSFVNKNTNLLYYIYIDSNKLQFI